MIASVSEMLSNRLREADYAPTNPRSSSVKTYTYKTVKLSLKTNETSRPLIARVTITSKAIPLEMESVTAS